MRPCSQATKARAQASHLLTGTKATLGWARTLLVAGPAVDLGLEW